ncbi:MAG: cyclic nucleotide-binding domain-containing protein [Pseudomonadota bacterium]
MDPQLAEQLGQALGVTGVLCYMTAYGLLQFGVLKGGSYPYTALNLFAATCVLISLIWAFNMFSFAIQVFFIVVSLIALARRYIEDRRISLSEEERAFAAEGLSSLPTALANRIIRNGSWHYGNPGDQLTKMGAPVSHLIYLSTGKAEVVVADRIAGMCRSGNFIGEFTVTTGKPATATVTLTQPSRYFSISSEVLRRLIARDAELREGLSSSFARATQKKLLTAAPGLVPEYA